MPKHKIFATTFARVYPMYVHKTERENRTKEEVDQIICWLTGYDQAGLRQQIEEVTAIPRAALYRLPQVSAPLHAVYEPAIRNVGPGRHAHSPNSERLS